MGILRWEALGYVGCTVEGCVEGGTDLENSFKDDLIFYRSFNDRSIFSLNDSIAPFLFG